MCIRTSFIAVTLFGSMAVPALAFPVHQSGYLNVGGEILAEGQFQTNHNNLFGVMFTIHKNVTVGSGLALTIDSFNSHRDFGTNTELSLYSSDGTHLYAINDDFYAANPGDSYLGFGDATRPSNPFAGNVAGQNTFNGNPINLSIGTYVAVIGAYDTVWNTDQMQDTVNQDNPAEGYWYLTIRLEQVPAPGGIALFGICGFIETGTSRRRRSCN